jgi:hypothetical protein
MFDIVENTKDNVKATVNEEFLCDRPKLKDAATKRWKELEEAKGRLLFLQGKQRKEILLWFKI